MMALAPATRVGIGKQTPHRDDATARLDTTGRHPVGTAATAPLSLSSTFWSTYIQSLDQKTSEVYSSFRHRPALLLPSQSAL